MAAQDKRTLTENLRDIEARRLAGDASVDLLCERANHLSRLGETDEARRQYLDVLQREPTHFAALINFGALLYETDFRTAARTVFAQAVAEHPHEPIAHVNLGNALMYADELGPARECYETALRLDPGNIHAHQRLSSLFQETGEIEAMRRHYRLGFAEAPPRRLPCLGDGDAVSLLLLTSTPGGDVAWRKLVDRAVFSITELTAEFHDPAAPLPPHDLIFNAIGDA
ncbi:MAG: tetratricopeptide repeat protein, partial [Caulobacteraceae bacterium]